MADNYIRLADTIASDEGKAYITIDGQNREMFELQSLDASLSLTVISRRMLGRKMTQHKVVGAEGTGNATLYFMNSTQLNNTIEYIKTGRWKSVKVQVKNEDPQSTIGKQEVVLENVIFESIPVTKVAEGDDPITFDSGFTFDGIENLESFQLPINYR
jgi:hypothetical protein